MKVADFDYALPPDRIAQRPSAERDESRLLVLARTAGSADEHARFRDLVRYLKAGDLLVLNDTKVWPARLLGTKSSGGRIEILLVEPDPSSLDTDERADVWLCMAGFSRAPAAGARLDLGGPLEAEYLGPAGGELHRVRIRPAGGLTLREAIARAGLIPLPPYIHRNGAEAELDDAARYQTIYAEREGAIAAPTAGLHFTEALLGRLADGGVEIARVTLHVGPATFLPVRTEDAEDHPMPAERYEVSSAVRDAVARSRARGGRIVAVGTTVVRALESASDGRGGVLPSRGRSDLFIYPGYRFRVVDGLITNFHLPRSTLLMLVCAFAGRERLLAAYERAVAMGYRFYSYGDAMLIL